MTEPRGHDFDAIRRDHLLAGIVGETVKLRRAGSLQEGCCPFHTDKSPSFYVYPDERYHCFGCGAHGDVIDFVATLKKCTVAEAIASLTGGAVPVMSDADRKRRAEERRLEDLRQQKRQETARQAAQARWDAALPVNGVGNAYLTAKNVAPYGTRREGDNLLVPVWGADGDIQTVQSIPPDKGGRKLFHSGAPASGGRLTLGAPTGQIIVCEGFATGATVQAATGEQVCIAFSKQNVDRIVEELVQDGTSYVIIGADSDAEDAMRAIGLKHGAPVVVADLQGADGKDFNDQAAHYGLEDVAETFKRPIEVAATPKDRAIVATPFLWRDEAEIPARQWLYGKHLLRGFVSVDVAAGGVGKSSLKIGEAMAMASGEDLYSQTIHGGPHTVWIYNLEDPVEETERRIHATAKRFGLKSAAFGNRLYVDSGRVQRCVLAEETAAGVVIVRPVADALIAELQDRKIDVLIIDPFVSSHAVSENDNGAIDMVAKEWSRIAEICNCSINLVHHVRKQNGTEANADSARGASALIGAARSVMVYNRMTPDEAAKLNVPEDELRFHFRVDNDKANLAPPSAAAWYRMNNQDLVNGDQIGVACAWTPPDLFAGITVNHLRAVQASVASGEWRENIQSSAWVGMAVANAMNLDADDKRDRQKIRALIHVWLKEGVLAIDERKDNERKMRKYVVVGRVVEGATL